MRRFICVLSMSLMAFSLMLASAVMAQTPALPVVSPDTGTINWWMLAGTLGTAVMTTVVMTLLKRFLPDWDRKAWAPPIIGAVLNVLAAMSAGQITSLSTLLSWVLTGALAGGLGSSARDVVKGK